jgi:hypothetical protein
MQDTCTITRVTGETTDPETGRVIPTTVGVYSGKCRLQQRALISRSVDVGEAYVYQVPYELHIPMDVTGVQIQDVVQVDSSALDQDLVGRSWWLKGLAGGTQKTARRFSVEEVVG